MYSRADEGVQFAATEVFSLLRRNCSVSNGAGVQRERYIQEIAEFIIKQEKVGGQPRRYTSARRADCSNCKAVLVKRRLWCRLLIAQTLYEKAGADKSTPEKLIYVYSFNICLSSNRPLFRRLLTVPSGICRIRFISFMG